MITDDKPPQMNNLNKLSPNCSMLRFICYFKLFFSADPTEHFDIADRHPDVLEKMKDMLKQYRESLVPANQPDPDPKSNPKNFDGNWSPGWCP